MFPTSKYQYHKIGDSKTTHRYFNLKNINLKNINLKSINLPTLFVKLLSLIIEFFGNSILTHSVFSIVAENSVSINIAGKYDFNFLCSLFCHGIALCINARITKSKWMMVLIVIIYLSWIYALKCYVVGLPMDLTIHVFLYLHVLSTIGIVILCFLALFLFDRPKVTKKIFLWVFVVIFLIVLDVKCEKYPFVYWLLGVNYNIQKWNEYGFNSKYINNNISGHACPIFIDNRIIPWLDILPHRWSNFYLGSGYYCNSDNFSFIDFETDTLIIHCDKSELEIYFGSDYLSEYEETAKGRFDGNHLEQFKPWQSKQPWSRFTVQFSDNYVHKIDLQKLSLINDYRTEILTIECGANVNAHFIPHKIKTPKNELKKRSNDSNALELPSSILIFIIDSTGRHDFHRKLTKTSSILEKISSKSVSTNHEFYEFMRVNIVGHSTSANLGPFFFGDREETIEQSLWQAANQNGFTTGLLWDECTASFYWDDAFHNRSSHLSPDNMNIFGCQYDFDVFGNQGFINSGKGSISLNDKCNYQKMTHEHMLQYQTLLHKWNNQSSVFSISHTQIGHDGVGVSVIAVDEYLAEWLQTQVVESDTFDDTLIILMSDHGMHFGVPDLLDVGQIEHHLSTMLWLYPKKRLNEDINDKLRHNEQSLVTVFDFRNTILSMINPDKKVDVKSNFDGMNVMKEYVPYNRTCSDAYVSKSRCACMNKDGTFSVGHLKTSIRS